MIDIIIRKKNISKTMILSIWSKHLKIRAKKSNDLYFKTDGWSKYYIVPPDYQSLVD